MGREPVVRGCEKYLFPLSRIDPRTRTGGIFQSLYYCLLSIEVVNLSTTQYAAARSTPKRRTKTMYVDALSPENGGM